MPAQTSRRRAVLTRLLIGLSTLVVGTMAAAWLMHAGIDADGERAEAAITTGSIGRGPLADVRSWSLHAERAADADLVVVDPVALAGLDATALPAAVEAMKRRDGGRPREVIARVAIASFDPVQMEWLTGVSGARSGGQAAWLLDGKVDRNGRTPVAFWSGDWQGLVLGSPGALVDRIAAAGFDGLYIADGEAYIQQRASQQTAETDFADLVSRISQRAKAINPDFAIILANAEELVVHPAVKGAVDAFAREDLLFGAEEPGRANARSAVVSSVHFLGRARREGRLVLVAEHIDDPADIATARTTFGQQGFVGAIAPLAVRTNAVID